MSKCEACPVADGPCRSEADPRYGFFCAMAASGDPSQLASIRAASGAPPPAAYPSLARQAANLAGSFATWFKAGCPVTPKAERGRRRAICLRCPSGMFDADARRCRACGCFGDLKPWLGTATCPRGHWNAADPEEPTPGP